MRFNVTNYFDSFMGSEARMGNGRQIVSSYQDLSSQCQYCNSLHDNTDTGWFFKMYV